MSARTAFGVWRYGVRAAAAAAAALVHWTLWLVLGLGIAVQVYVASTKELALPGFVRRALEDRLALSGIRATFGQTHFDPSGRILVEDVRVMLPGFEEPLVTARSVFLRVDPWALAARRFEPLELRATGASLRVPAQLSPSGEADEIVRDLDMAVRLRGRELAIDALNARIGNLAVSARGSLILESVRGGGHAPLPFAEFVARHYAEFSHECAGAIEGMRTLDEPILRIELTPSESSSAWVHFEGAARGLRLSAPFSLQVKNVRAEGRFPLLGERPFRCDVIAAAGEAQSGGPENASAIGIGVWAGLELAAEGAGSKGPILTVRAIDACAAGASADGLAVRYPIVSVEGPGLRGIAASAAGEAVLDAQIRAWLWGSPVAVRAQVDRQSRRADLTFSGALGPEAVGFVGARIGRNLGRFVELKAPVTFSGEARFGPGWTFAGASAQVAAEGVVTRGVTIDEVRGRVEFDGARLVSPRAYARIGDNYARGTFEQNVAARTYRFLLDGRLRPLDITPWIIGQWWSEVFGKMAFPAEPPEASLDLRGCWTSARQAVAFVAVDSSRPVIRGVSFDRVRTRIFARPEATDALGFSASRNGGSVSGTFLRRYDVKAGQWRSLDFDVTSTLDLPAVAGAMGRAGESSLEPFWFDKPPAVRASGHFDGPAAPGGPSQQMHIEAKSDGAFRYRDFPFESVSFTADMRNDSLTIAPIAAGFADGSLTGTARMWGLGPERRLKIEASLSNAGLRQAIMVVDSYTARRNKRTAPAPGVFVNEKSSVRIDVSASAEGNFKDPMSFQGSGSAQLSGSELGSVRLFGLLSELLRFTSLRFTSARGDFQLKGSQLVFPSVSVTGANSGIDAHGTYDLARHQLDFKARIDPFQESKGLPQKMMDVVLAPISSVLEVSLTGSIEKPQWAFANSPVNLLRSKPDSEPSSPPPAAAPNAHPSPVN